MSRLPDQKQIGNAVVSTLLAEAGKAERQLDDALNYWDNLSSEDLEGIRKKRIKELKDKALKEQEWKRKGHGKYDEVADQPAWFQEVKDNERVVCHFYRASTRLCEILDRHFSILATKHMGTRFIKVNAENSPFLCERLNVTVMPTVIMTKDGFTCDRLEGFTELGNTDKFTTQMLEERLSKRGAIDYEPPVKAPADMLKKHAVADNPTGAAIYASRRAAMFEDLDEDLDEL